MEKYELQKLRDLPIEGVAERLGLQVVRHKALCPFHDDHHASLSFSIRRNTFRCFACGAHGGTIDLAMRVLNKPFLEACNWLSLTPDPSPIERGPMDRLSPFRHLERSLLSCFTTRRGVYCTYSRDDCK